MEVIRACEPSSSRPDAVINTKTIRKVLLQAGYSAPLSAGGGTWESTTLKKQLVNY